MAQPDGDVEPQRPAGWRWWKPSETTAKTIVVVIPIALIAFTQLDFAQNVQSTIEENQEELVEIQRSLNQPLTCRDEG